MPYFVKKEDNSTQCPWWRRVYGLHLYSQAHLLKDSRYGLGKKECYPVNGHGHLDLSFWPLQHSDFIEIDTNYIESLNLASTSQLKESSILYLAKNWQGCPLLHLNLAGCNHVTNSSCKAIGRHFNYLKEINLNDCFKVTDKGITNLMRCKYLEEICLRNIHRLEDRGLLCIRENMIVMKVLRILGT